MSWVLNGQYLLLGTNTNNQGLVLVDPKSGRIARGSSTRACGYDGLVTSANGQWIATYSYGTGTAGTIFCITKIGGPDHALDGSDATAAPIWDSTGNFLYYVSHSYQKIGTIYYESGQLLKYDVRKQQAEQLIPLGLALDWWFASLSPDGITLEAHSTISAGVASYIILDSNSPSTVKHTWNIQLPGINERIRKTAWSSDSEHIVLFSPSAIDVYHMPGTFYTLDVHTGQTTVISGKHLVREWAVSPAVTSP